MIIAETDCQEEHHCQRSDDALAGRKHSENLDPRKARQRMDRQIAGFLQRRDALAGQHDGQQRNQRRYRFASDRNAVDDVPWFRQTDKAGARIRRRQTALPSWESGFAEGVESRSNVEISDTHH